MTYGLHVSGPSVASVQFESSPSSIDRSTAGVRPRISTPESRSNSIHQIFLKGIVNLRGTIVPVIDLRVKFGLANPAYDSFTVVIVLRIAGRIVGAVVDAVSDVVQLAPGEIKAAPRLGSIVDSSYLSGVATQDDRMILALDIEKLLSAGELDLLGEAAGSAAAAS